MKEAPPYQLLHNLRSGPNNSPLNRVHERGDKVVVNGAKQSLLSILRRYTCQCTKHTLEKLTSKFLTLSKVSASYDILVWMLLFIKLNSEPALYSLIIKEYLMKMQKKRDEEENHQSQKYIESKKKTLQKFIQSAEELEIDQINEKAVERSVGALYSKGKSRENAFNKLKVYLEKVNHNSFDGSFGFQETSCSFMLPTAILEESQFKNQAQQISNEEQLLERKKLQVFCAVETAQGQKIFNLSPLEEEETEETVEKKAQNYENKSYRDIPKRESYDLFDELIQDESYSSLLPYYFNPE